MTEYVGLRHFTYSEIRVEPGLVFSKLAVRVNALLESRGFVELYLGKEDDLVRCPECPAKFVGHHYMKNHVERNVHKGGRVISSEEGIRTAEQEEELDDLIKSIPKERPGLVDAAPDGSMGRSSRRVRQRS